MFSSIYNILPTKIKISSIIIILLIILGTIIEILGIGMVLPILNTLVQENYLENNFVRYLSTVLKNPEKTDFIIYCVSILMLIYVLKSFLLTFINFKISRLNKKFWNI